VASPGSDPQAVILPVVPLFHANAWGLPYMAPMQGSKLVFADPHLDPAELYGALERERVDAPLRRPDESGCGCSSISIATELRLSSVKLLGRRRLRRRRRAMIEAFEVKYGNQRRLNAWGMTETSPACT